MASQDHPLGFSKHFSGKLHTLTRKSTEDDVRRVYDDWAGQYDEELRLGGSIKQPTAEFIDASINEVFPDKAKSEIRIVDAGAGTGLVGVELNKLGYTNIDALDISQGMLDEAKKKNVYRKYICAPLSDLRTSGIEAGEYDVAISVGVFCVGQVKPQAYVEMIRMVKNGGLVCFNLRPDSVEHYREKMEELEKDGMWKLVKEGRVSYYISVGMPPEYLTFTYKVTYNRKL